MKKITRALVCALLAAVFLTAFLLPAAAASAAPQTKNVSVTYRGISIFADGTLVVPKDATGAKVEPFILDGTTYLPIRAVAGALGLAVGWDDASSTVTLTSGGQKTDYGSEIPAYSRKTQNAAITYRGIVLKLDGKTVTPKDANGNTVEPFILDGTTYLPVRAVASALGQQVGWDAASSSVFLGKQPTDSFWRPVSDYTYVDGKLSNAKDYTYNENGFAATLAENSSDSGMTVTTYTYDANGWLIREEDTGDTTGYAVYTNDSKGNPTRVEAKYGDLSYYTLNTYDAGGRLVKSHKTFSGSLVADAVTENVYDGSGNLVRTDYTEKGDGYVYACTAKHTYNAAGNLAKSETVTAYTDTKDAANSNTSDAVVTYTYDAAGFLVGEQAQDGSYSAVYVNDKSGNVLSLVYKYSDGTTQACKYAYDAAGNCVRIETTDTDGSTSVETFAYDEAGNLLSDVSDLGGSTTKEEYTYICFFVF